MAEHWQTGEEDNRTAKVNSRDGLHYKVESIERIASEIAFKSFFSAMRDDWMVDWRWIALQKLLGDGLHHAVEWIGWQLHQRLLTVLLGEGDDCFMLYWRKIALHKLLRDGNHGLHQKWGWVESVDWERKRGVKGLNMLYRMSAPQRSVFWMLASYRWSLREMIGTKWRFS